MWKWLTRLKPSVRASFSFRLKLGRLEIVIRLRPAVTAELERQVTVEV